MPTRDTASELAALDAINGGIIVLDSDERVVHWNPWMAAAAGQTLAEVGGKSLAEIFPLLDSRRLNSAVKAAITTGASTGISHALNAAPLPLRTRAGRTLTHDITVSPIYNRNDAACLIFIADITSAAHREQYLREQHKARYNAVVESAADVIMTIDEDGLIQMVNPAAASLFGIPMVELTGRAAEKLFAAGSNWPMLRRTVLDGTNPAQSTELVAVRRDGSPIYVEATASRWYIGSRAVVTVILRDISERRAINGALRASEAAARNYAAALADLNQSLERRVEERTAQLMKTEEALRQSQKMEAIGQLTGGIAHDFNNLLQGITGSLHVVQKLIAAGRPGETERFLKGALDSSYRAASLTQRLLAFSRQQPINAHPVNENESILSMQEMLRRTIGENVQLSVKAEPQLWLVKCDANQLENALLNLAINARDAMPNGGTLTFETSNTVLEVNDALRRELMPGEYVRLVVRDNGEGMPPEVKARVFEPFFTTKAIGKGTGLGLSMIYGFVKQADGSVQIDSEPGKGTSIEICLPRFVGELDSTQAIGSDADPDARQALGEVVLVVEDEGIVRMPVVETLKELGYCTLEADNGTAAIRILESPQHIDLLITDLGLPDMSGNRVVQIARAIRKNLKVLRMTGYADKAVSDVLMEDGAEVIPKPFDMEVMTLRIRRIIEGT